MADESDPCPCGSDKNFKDCHLDDPSFALAVGVDAAMNEVGARCIRRPLFLTDLEGYELAGEGTCFLVKAEGAIWIATGKHVLRGIDGRKLVVSSFMPREGTAPLGPWLTSLAFVAPESETNDAADPSFDLALFLTDQTEHPDAFDLTPLTSVAPLNRVPVGARVKVFGFPTRLGNHIDYDSGAIHAKAQYVGGRYDGPTGLPHQYQMSLDKPDLVTSGMSGGPVFMLYDGEIVLAGITTHAAENTNRARFVDARWLPTLAEEHHAPMAVANTIGKTD